MNRLDESEDVDEELLSHVSLYGWLWTRRASELLAAERAGCTGQRAPDERSVT